MSELNFDVELKWSGTGEHGSGELNGEEIELELSAPKSMGGRGTGTNPEELLVSAVSSCYIATLFGVLDRADLPVDSVAVTATGTVTGFPGKARFERLVVNPTIVGADTARQEDYEAAAARAHDRCLIGKALSSEVAYEVGSVLAVSESEARA